METEGVFLPSGNLDINETAKELGNFCECPHDTDDTSCDTFHHFTWVMTQLQQDELRQSNNVLPVCTEDYLSPGVLAMDYTVN